MILFKHFARFVLFVLITSLALVGPALAQSGGQVNITGDLFEIDQTAQTATFTGNVHATQETFQLWAPIVIAYYGDGGPSDLKKITADGRVRVEFGTQKAISDRGVYDPKTRLFTMIGNVSATQEGSDDVVNSNKMIIDLNKNTTRFDGNGTDGGRVNATFGSGN